MKLLFITPKIKEDDNDFAFAEHWVKEFANQGFKVSVICLEKGKHTLPSTVSVYSLGREKGWPVWRSFLWFQILIWKIPHERVFVHMNPRWLAAYWLRWLIGRKPAYLWYTHYTQPLSLKIGAHFVKRMFAATNACLPQYKEPQKVVTGHGIDLNFWDTKQLPEHEMEPYNHLLAVHRISRSKRIDIVLRALKLLPAHYTLTHYGRPMDPREDPKYYEELQELINSLELTGRVKFMGPVTMSELRNIYPRYRVLVNMVPDTIDKTVLEAMYCGVQPLITKGHAEAIGLKRNDCGVEYGVMQDRPEVLAEYIDKNMNRLVVSYNFQRQCLRQIVEEKHSLAKLVQTMGKFIRAGN